MLSLYGQPSPLWRFPSLPLRSRRFSTGFWFGWYGINTRSSLRINSLFFPEIFADTVFCVFEGYFGEKRSQKCRFRGQDVVKSVANVDSKLHLFGRGKIRNFFRYFFGGLLVRPHAPYGLYGGTGSALLTQAV